MLGRQAMTVLPHDVRRYPRRPLMPPATPVSDALVAELRTALRERGLVTWADPARNYVTFVASLDEYPSRLGHPVVSFRGSWLAWLESLGERPEGRDPTPLLVHLPGLDDAKLRETPAFPIVQMGFRFERALSELVRDAAAGVVTPDRTEAFLWSSELTLESADAWLSDQRRSRDAERAALYARFTPDVLLDDLLALSTGAPSKMLGAGFATRADVAALEEHLHVVLGMSPAWRVFCANARGSTRTSSPHDDADAVRSLRDRVTEDLVAWILSVEYARDLQREPRIAELAPLRSLSALLAQRCIALADHLRTHHASRYASLADDVELLLRDGELYDLKADDLGQIDTFRCEEHAVLKDAVRGLQQSQWGAVTSMADARLSPGRSFWLGQTGDEWSRLRRWAWMLVRQAATLGDALSSAAPHSELRGLSLEEIADVYAAKLASVDRAHREFEQRIVEKLDPRMEHYGELQDVAARLRGLYRAWADKLAREFSARCRERGFLPESRYQQRTLYEQVVQPHVERGQKVALFLVDALRYEMATELADLLVHDERTQHLSPRLAELPTLTAVGMNALAPVSRNGRLEVVREFEGFRAGEFTVARPDDRARAVGQRSLGQTKALLLDLAAVCSAAPSKDLAKQVAQRQVIVVQSREIDDAGEANVGVRTFEGTLRDLAAAWHLLNAAGVEVCVFTADHGFLLQDSTTRVQPFGTKRDPKRRYVLDAHPRAEEGMVHVAVSALGYEGLDGYLLFRDDTAVFATGTAGASFVHGGNSLQERVIPVLVVEAKRARPATEQRFEIVAEPMAALLGHHRVRVKVTRAEGATSLLPLEKKTVDVAVRVLDRSDVQVVLRDVQGPGALRSGGVQLGVDDDWTEFYFKLEGPLDERVRVEFFHPDNPRLVSACTLATLFDVAGVVRKGDGPRRTPSSSRITAVAPSSWSEQFADEGVRQVFLHIEKHGAITEAEATKMLGSSRAFRRFSAEFETHEQKAPFRVRIDSGAEGKRYVRTEER